MINKTTLTSMASNVRDYALGVAGAAAIGGGLGTVGAAICGWSAVGILHRLDMLDSCDEYIRVRYGDGDFINADKVRAFMGSFVLVPAACAVLYAAMGDVQGVIESRLNSNKPEHRYSLVNKNGFVLRKAVSLARIAAPILCTHQLFNKLGYEMGLLEVVLKGYVLPGVTGLSCLGLATFLNWEQVDWVERKSDSTKPTVELCRGQVCPS